MKKFISLALIPFLFTSNLFATTAGLDVNDLDVGQRTQLKAPLTENLFKSTQWDLFLTEFQVNFDIGTCGEGLDYRLGFKAHMIEPIGYFETSKKPLYFPFAKFDLDGNIMKSGHSRATITEESGRDEFIWSHFIYAPIMGMIFKQKIKGVCFHGGSVALPLITEMLPPYSRDIMFKNMIAPMIMMFNPQSLVASIIDCAAAETMGVLNGYASGTHGNFNEADVTSTTSLYEDSNPNDPSTFPDGSNFSQKSLKDKGIDYLKFIRNSMYWNVGCLGFAPVGGYIEGQDPGVDQELLMYQSLNLLQGASTVLPAPFLYKQTNFSADTSESSKSNSLAILDSMCSPKRYPLGIESQYVPQTAFPVVRSAHELGMSPVTTTTATNMPGAKDSYVSVVWERRDYLMFAYFCPKSGDEGGAEEAADESFESQWGEQ